MFLQSTSLYPLQSSRRAHRLTRTVVCLLVWIACTAFSSFLIAQDGNKATKPGSLPEEIASVLTANGLRIVGSNLTLDLDTEVIREVKELAKFKKSLMLADRERYAIEAEVETIKQQGSNLRRKHTLLSAQLANAGDVITNNRLVGELNATAGLIDALGEQQTVAADKAKEARAKVNEVREEFVKTLLTLRQSSDKAYQKWETLAADQEVIAAVEKAAAETGKKLTVKPSAGLVAAEKQLKNYEESVISESLPLEGDRGNYWVNVVINDKPFEKMVVDSGASTISLSSDLAKKLDIKPKETDPDIVVGLADGSRIPGKLVKLASVRVGKFTAENVECVVLGAEAVNAPPLLGMSFLGQFKFELDAAQSQLKLVKVDSGEPPPSSSKSKRKPR